jgi:tetratricopeptide (TPR) repeat protein
LGVELKHALRQGIFSFVFHIVPGGTMKLLDRTNTWVIGSVVVLLAVLEAQLLFSVHNNSQTFDETAHIYSGYTYWKTGDFGVNPEHPPLEKLVDSISLLPTGIKDPQPPPMFFRGASVIGGLQLLYSNDADALLFRARAMATIFTLTCAILVFLAASEMFGVGAGLLSLLIFVFEPNILANGALVDTDIGATCFVFATVYAFYRYCKNPTLLRLAVCCLAAGLALAAKHSTVLLLPIFIILAVYEIARRRSPETGATESRTHQSLRLLGVMALVMIVAVTILWSFYGFRYAARPGNAQLIPTTADYLHTAEKYPYEASVIAFMEHHRLMPEAYLFGMTDIVMISRTGRPTFLLGHNYAVGKWFYFPTIFVIKSTIGFLILLALTFAARPLWRREDRRELVFLIAPPLLWLAVSLTSKLDLGLRHILPMFPFLIVLTGAVAWTLIRKSRAWAAVAVALLVFHMASSLHAYPNYLPYSNEAFGGPSNTYRVLSDANVGWEGGLKTLAAYLKDHHITQCWLAFDGPNNPDYYHIPCKPLPSMFTIRTGRSQVVPQQLEGPVFLGSQTLTGFDYGPDELNPFQQFVNRRPVAVIGGEILEYDGEFNLPVAAAISHVGEAQKLMRQKQFDAAAAECKEAIALDPQSFPAHLFLLEIYKQRNQMEEAENEYRTAMHIYMTVHPDYQAYNDPPVDPMGKP